MKLTPSTLLFAFTLLALTGIPSALAAAPNGAPNRAACTEIINARAELRPPSGLGVLWTLFRLRFFPGALVHLDTVQVPIVPELRVASEAPPVQGNVIFSIEPPSEVALSPEVATMRHRYAELLRLIQIGLNGFRQIAGARTVEECMARAERAKFDFDGFMKLARERSALGLVEQIDEGRLATQVIQRTLPHLRLKWRVVRSTDLMAVHEALRDPQLRNVVILAHGLSGGKLVDSRLSEYPLGFFSEIAPGIRTISIFACHGEEIAKLYQVAAHLGAVRSQFAMRALFVSRGIKLGSLEEIVPVRGFPSFMAKVDRALARPLGVEPPVEVPGTPDARCLIHVSGLRISAGTLGFVLNGRFIGSENTGDAELALGYPCAFEDRKKNILIIRNLSLLVQLTLASTDFKIEPEHLGHILGDARLKHYLRADGTYQSSKYEFTMD